MKKILLLIAFVFIVNQLFSQISRYKTWWSNEEEARFINDCNLPPFESEIDKLDRQYRELSDEYRKLESEDPEYMKKLRSEAKEKESLYDYHQNDNSISPYQGLLEHLELIKNKKKELLNKMGINRQARDRINIYGQVSSGYGINPDDYDKANFLKLIAAYKFYDCSCMLNIAKSKYKNGIIASEEISKMSNKKIAEIFKSCSKK